MRVFWDIKVRSFKIEAAANGIRRRINTIRCLDAEPAPTSITPAAAEPSIMIKSINMVFGFKDLSDVTIDGRAKINIVIIKVESAYALK